MIQNPQRDPWITTRK